MKKDYKILKYRSYEICLLPNLSEKEKKKLIKKIEKQKKCYIIFVTEFYYKKDNLFYYVDYKFSFDIQKDLNESDKIYYSLDNLEKDLYKLYKSDILKYKEYIKSVYFYNVLYKVNLLAGQNPDDLIDILYFFDNRNEDYFVVKYKDSTIKFTTLNIKTNFKQIKPNIFEYLSNFNNYLDLELSENIQKRLKEEGIDYE